MSGFDPYAAIARKPNDDPYASVAKPASGRYDEAGLRNLWIKAGGDPKDADLMAHVALNESAGDPTAHNSYSDSGKTYHVRGLWQISDIHAHGSSFDPFENARAAVALYRSGGTQPWEDSRSKGAYGGWGKYLAQRGKQGHTEADFRNRGAAPHVANAQTDPLRAMMQRLGQPIVGTASAAETDPYASVAKPTDPYASVAKPTPTAAPTNPMDTTGGAESNPVAGATAHSLLNQLGGHQDVMFILHNAQLRDGGNASIADLLKKPTSHVAQAFALWKRDPAAAMDEYGLGSPKQNTYMAQHFPNSMEGKYGKFMGAHPKTNAAVTFIEEMFNPVAWAEGGVAGKALGALGKAAGVTKAAQAVAKPLGLGSPLAKIAERGGTEGVQWTKGLIASIKHADSMSHAQMLDIFGGLNNAEQREVVRLSQGLKPDPQFFRQYVALEKRANALRADIGHVTNERVRAGHLRDTVIKNGKVHYGNVYDRATYFPMKNGYDFGDDFELIQRLKGTGRSASTAKQPKVFANLDEATASGLLDKDFSPAKNYETWRRQAMQNVAFEDMLKEAPSSLRLDSTKQIRAATSKAGVANVGGKDYAWVQKAVRDANKVVHSPTLRKSYLAPELLEFFGDNGTFQHYVGKGSYLPGEAETFGGRLVGIFRNAIVSNPVFHPAVNVAGNDAAARGMKNLGGPAFEVGGYGYNAAKALALQAGLKKPEDFIKGARDYAHWYDRALKAGGIAEFGSARKSMLGGESARVLTEPNGSWMHRIDRAMTRFGDWNKERTFGDKGEAAFAVSLFKDAVEKGKLSDYDAARVVREALGDYYNFDPKSHLSAGFLFMPWLKSNTKFWVNVLTHKPQYVTAPQHAIRNYNAQQGDPGVESDRYAPPDWRVFTGNNEAGAPTYRTPPFVGRIISDVVNAVEGVKDPNEGLYSMDKVLEGRANPFIGIALDAKATADAMREGKDVQGPETDYHLIFNPKAPPKEKFAQIGRYMVGHGLPVPLFRYALEDAMRKGMDAHDLTTALLTAGGAGYGSEGLSDVQRREVNAAKKVYLRSYYAAQDNHDDALLEIAWSQYTDRLREIGVLH